MEESVGFTALSPRLSPKPRSTNCRLDSKRLRDVQTSERIQLERS